jgi:hypothetical protein
MLETGKGGLGREGQDAYLGRQFQTGGIVNVGFPFQARAIWGRSVLGGPKRRW